MYHNRFKHIICLVLLLAIPVLTQGQNTGVIKGTVVDSLTEEKIYGANVFITELSKGAATDLYGDFQIKNVPEGDYNLRISYLSYETKFVEVNVIGGGEIELLINLDSDVVEGSEVQVFAQAIGQAAAIRKQLQSNTIVNVVSSERINSLPDQNIAESISRLPGISVQRDGGEGQKVVIRGLSPKYSNVTVNGVKLPGTDVDDRSVDLSMISPDILSGVEVYKALTPDQDGDGVGGSVNLTTQNAPQKPKSNFRLEGGYNDHETEFGQYKISAGTSRRFLEGDKLGLLVSGSIQRVNRSSDRFTADYDAISQRPSILTETVNLDDRLEIRKRYSANTSIDYKLDNGLILVNSFFGYTDRDEIRRRKRYKVSDFRTEYDVRHTQRNIFLLSNSLRGIHDIGNSELTWNTSFSQSTRDHPNSTYMRFLELAAYNSEDLEEDRGPERIPEGAKNNLEETTMLYSSFNTLVVKDKDFVGKFDFKTPYRITDGLEGYFKFGGKLQSKNRFNKAFAFVTPFGITDSIGQANPEDYTLYRGAIKIENFIDEDYDDGNFLNNSVYDVNPGLDYQASDNFYQIYKAHYDTNRVELLKNYDASETTAAGYAMSELNIGSKLMLLSGVRIERTSNDYDGLFGRLREALGKEGTISDTTGGQSYYEILPMVHARIRFTNFMDMRLAVTRSLSRPNFYNLVPYESINTIDRIVNRGNPELKHTKVWNYDAFISFHKSNVGLLTVGGFYKKLDDIDYVARTIDEQSGLTEGYFLITPINSPESTVKGIEAEIQTSFNYLPQPLNGLILSFNISRMWSETFFPRLKQGGRSPDPPFEAVYYDTVRSAKMPDQPDIIANASIGYEIGGFSARVSYTYQDAVLAQVSDSEDTDIFTEAVRRWDVSAFQRINENLRITFSANNITNNADKSFFGSRDYPTNLQQYGWTADIGIRYNF